MRLRRWWISFFGAPGDYGLLSAWLAVVFYAVQIYCDFSGYTDMALACAGLLGYRLAWNFDFPYLAADVSQFWRRWHMSLSSWLRDYLYIPLGGNRGSRWFIARNLMVTMLLGGLWHGAAWHFVFWGGATRIGAGNSSGMERPLAGTKRRLHRRAQAHASVATGGRDAADVLLGVRVLGVFPRVGLALGLGSAAAVRALADGRPFEGGR